MFVKQTLELGFKRCNGCQKHRLSPIAHAHFTTSLIEKIHYFFAEIRFEMCENVGDLLARYKSLWYIKNSLDEDNEVISEGIRFLKALTPFGLYYGNYLSTEDEVGFYDQNVKIPNQLFVKKKSSTEKVPEKKRKLDNFDGLRSTKKISRKKLKLNEDEDISPPSEDF